MKKIISILLICSISCSKYNKVYTDLEKARKLYKEEQKVLIKKTNYVLDLPSPYLLGFNYVVSHKEYERHFSNNRYKICVYPKFLNFLISTSQQASQHFNIEEKHLSDSIYAIIQNPSKHDSIFVEYGNLSYKEIKTDSIPAILFYFSEFKDNYLVIVANRTNECQRKFTDYPFFLNSRYVSRIRFDVFFKNNDVYHIEVSIFDHH